MTKFFIKLINLIGTKKQTKKNISVNDPNKSKRKLESWRVPSGSGSCASAEIIIPTDWGKDSDIIVSVNGSAFKIKDMGKRQCREE